MAKLEGFVSRVRRGSSEIMPAQDHTLCKDLDNGTLQCLVCPRQCILPPGGEGWCHVRANYGGQLVPLTYGQLVDLHAGILEEKALYHFYPQLRVLGLGAMGCTLDCAFCQNWEIAHGLRLGSIEPVKTSLTSPEDVIEEAQREACGGLGFTYTEPCASIEYALDVMSLAREYDLFNVWVSSGYLSSLTRARVFPFLDAIRIDLKCAQDTLYQDLTGGTVGPVLDTISSVREYGIWLEVSTVVIPGMTDTPETVRALAEVVLRLAGSATPLHLMRFLPAYRLSTWPPASLETMRQARRVALDCGLQYVYISNIPGIRERDTFCPQCGKVLVRRTAGSHLRLPERCQCGLPIGGIGLEPV